MAKLNVKTTPSNNTVVQGQALTASIANNIGTGIFVTDDVSLNNSLETIFGNTQNLPDNNKNVVDNIVDLDNKIDTTKSDLTQSMDAKIAIAKQDISSSVLTDVDQKILDARNDIDSKVDQTLQPLKTKVRDLEQSVSTLDTDTKQMFNLFNQDLNTKFSQLDNKLVTEVGNVTNGIDGKITVETSKLSTDINNKLQQFDTKVTQDLADAKQELNDKIDNLPSSTPAINALEQRLDTVEPKVDTLENNFTTLEGKHNTLSRKVTTVESDLNNQITKLNKLEGTVNTEIKKIPTLASNVRDIDNKVDDNLNLTKQKVTEINDKVDQELLKVNQSVSKIDPLVLKVDGHETRIQNVEAKADTNEQTLNTLGSKVNVAEQKSIEALNIANKNTQKVTALEGTVTQVESDLQDTNNNVRDLTSKVDDNLAEITKLKAKDSDLEQKITATDAKITPLSQKVDQNTAKLTTVESNVTNLTKKLTTVENKANEVDTVKASLSTLEGKVDQGLQDVKTSVAGVVQEQTALKQSVQLVSGNVTNLEQTVTQLENKVQNGNQSVTGLEARVQTAETKITAAEQGLQLSLAGLDAANKKDLQIEANLSATTQKVDAVEPKVTTLEQNVQSLQPKVNTNTQSIQDLTTKVSDVTQQATDLDNKIDTVDAKIDPLSKKLTQVEATVTSNTQTANDALQKATNAESIANGLDGRVSANEGNINALQTSVSDLETVRDDIKQDIKDLQLKDTTLEANYSVLNNKVTANETNVNKLNNKVSSLEQKDQDLEQAIQTTDGKIDPIKQSVTALTQKVTTVEQTANSANQLATSVNGEVTTLKQTVADHSQTLGQLDTTIDGKVQALDTKLSATISGLDTKVQANTGKVNQVETNLQGIDTRVGQVEIDLNNLTSTVDSNRQTLEQSIHDVNTDLGAKIDTLNNTTIPDLDTKLDTKIDTTKVDISNETDQKINTVKDELNLEIDLLKNSKTTSFSQFNTTVFSYREKVPGLDPAIANSPLGPIYRIPTLCIGDDGVIHVAADARERATDQERIEVVYARSFDGGKTWDKKVVGRRLTTGNNVDEATSRVMDPTLLYAGNGELYILAGRWTKGRKNWTQNQDSKNNWDAALLIKSRDNGATWTQHTIGVARPRDPEGTHIAVSNFPSTCKGFLGGIDAGIKHSSGRLVFAIQLTKGTSGSAETGLLYSDDGVTWTFSTETTGGVNYEPALAELIDGRLLIHCRSEDADAVVNGKSTKKAFITSDFGDSYQEFTPLSKKIGSSGGNGPGHRSEGGLMANKTVNGKSIIAACYPQNTLEPELGNSTLEYGRNQITLYGINLKKHSVVPIQMIQYESGAGPTTSGDPDFINGPIYGGYSSLDYNSTSDGEYLVVVYEDKLGISIKNLSNHIPRLERYCEPDEEVIRDKFKDYYINVDMTELPNERFVNSLDNEGHLKYDLSVIGFTGQDTITRSKLLPNGYRFTIPNKPTQTSNGLRGYIKIPSQNVNIITVVCTIAFPDPRIDGNTNGTWFPVWKLASHLDSPWWTCGVNVNIPADGFNAEIELMGARAPNNVVSWPDFQYGRPFHLVLEYTSNELKLYVDGVLLGKGNYDTTNNFSFNKILNMTKSLAVGGDGKVKEYTSEVGNFYIFTRKLTDEEMKYGSYRTSEDIVDSSFDRMNYITDLLKAEVTYLKKRLRKAEIGNVFSEVNKIPMFEDLRLNFIPRHFKINDITNDLVLEENYHVEFKYQDNVLTNFDSDVTSSQNDNTSGYVTTGDGYLYIGKDKEFHTFDISRLNLDPNNGYTIQLKWKSHGPTHQSTVGAYFMYTLPGNTFPGNNWRDLINGSGLLLKSYSTTTNTSQRFGFNGALASSSTVGTEVGDIRPQTMCSIVITVEGRTVKLYIDGALVNTETSNLDLEIGQIGLTRKVNNNAFSNIEIHALRAWGKALTDNEVASITNI